MSFTIDDVVYLYSGGIGNSDPKKSLGGPPSDQVIANGLDILFPRVTQIEANVGGQIYRCCYVANKGTSILTGLILWLDNDDVIESDVSIGFLLQNEVQKITLGGSPIGGSFKLSYTGNIGGFPVTQTTGDIFWSPTPSVIENNIATALNSLSLLGGITVSASYTTQWEYTVTFAGVSSKRNHALLQIAANNILGTGITLTTNTVTNGSPLNSVTVDIGFENQAPSGIIFTTPISKATGIPIGRLEPTDFFPVWFQRTTPSNTAADLDSVDKVNVKIFAHVFTS